jgi:hypothetical protein
MFDVFQNCGATVHDIPHAILYAISFIAGGVVSKPFGFALNISHLLTDGKP